VGAGGARTDGEKLLGPPGSSRFSVGVGATDDVVVVVVVLDGLGDSVVLQPAVSAPMAMIAPPPATSASRRAKRPDFIIVFLSYSIPGFGSNYRRLVGSGENTNVNSVPQAGQTVGSNARWSARGRGATPAREGVRRYGPGQAAIRA
jgi:hypothetical protein